MEGIPEGWKDVGRMGGRMGGCGTINNSSPKLLWCNPVIMTSLFVRLADGPVITRQGKPSQVQACKRSHMVAFTRYTYLMECPWG